jgi:Ca-activated chloride channel family protein
MARIKVGQPLRRSAPNVGQPFLAVLLFLFFAGPLSQGQTQQPTPPIRVSVSRVNVGVTVTDSTGHFIEGLHREDFQLFDNDAEQPITDFLPIEEPAQLLLLIESGPAIALFSNTHLRAADTLLTAIAPTDRVAIASYSQTPQLLLDFTPNKTQARATLQNLNFGNGFADLNLSSSLAVAIDSLAPVPGKKTIVLLSTGVDTSSVQSWPLIQQKLNTSDVRILAVSLAVDFRKPVKRKKLSAQERSERTAVNQVFGEADKWLTELSRATGGRAYFPQNAQEFTRAYAQIAQLIRHEYSLAFAPPAADGQLHSLKVKVKDPTYQVDYRQAYLAPVP